MLLSNSVGTLQYSDPISYLWDMLTTYIPPAALQPQQTLYSRIYAVIHCVAEMLWMYGGWNESFIVMET